MHITRNLKELKEIMANSKAFSLRRTLGSLALLAKPSHTFRTSGTDDVDAHYCWLENDMGRKSWFASGFEFSGTRRRRRMNPQGR